MGKAIHCECVYSAQGTSRLCLYHWGWAKLIDDARATMAGNERWTRLADEVPRTASFPLESSTERKLTVQSQEQRQESNR